MSQCHVHNLERKRTEKKNGERGFEEKGRVRTILSYQLIKVVVEGGGG